MNRTSSIYICSIRPFLSNIPFSNSLNWKKIYRAIPLHCVKMHILIPNSEQIEMEIFASCHISNILWNLFQDILNNILRPVIVSKPIEDVTNIQSRQWLYYFQLCIIICLFFLLYLTIMMIVNVKWYFTSYKRFTFQGCSIHWQSWFVMAQLKQSWQHWNSCIMGILWKTPMGRRTSQYKRIQGVKETCVSLSNQPWLSLLAKLN